MKKILGDAKSIRSLLGGAKFAIDYYQREYRWGEKHINELLNDLCEKFLETHEEDNERDAVIKNYGHYFLGSIIISVKESRNYIIDGQQRLTSLTLLLIYIYRQLKDDDQKKEIANLIFSYSVGRRSFNLDEDERSACMEALFTGKPCEENDQPESVINILKRYEDIENHFPDDLAGNALPYFADWLMENVYLVEITASSDADAYTIFETMNDRGLSLTPAEMLKGYLLSNITDPDRRNKASDVWRERISGLQKIGKDEDADAIKAWLRSQHAKTIRERSRGAKPLDFDIIGTEFHRWVRDRDRHLNLRTSTDFVSFIENDFKFYGQWYERVRKAAKTMTNGLEGIFYNAQNNFTLQHPALLASLTLTDNEEEINRKLRIVASYLDILVARRIWNWKAISYSTMQYSIFQLILKIRGKSADELVSILTQLLESQEESFDSEESFSLHGRNRRLIHLLLARMTDFVEVQSGRRSRFTEYIESGYEVEHIWADHPERHEDEFSHPTDFHHYRSHIGGLLLLPKSFNASYGDKPYADKREHYFSQNLLAQSLHENAYQHDPGFQRFRDKTALAFRSHAEFKKSDLEKRQALYLKLAEQIWNPENLQL